LFILFGGLLVVMLGVAGWWSQWLARNLSTELDEVAVTVGQSVVSVVGEERLNSFRFGPGHEPRVDVVVERIIETPEGRIRAIHRELDGQIVGFSTQVDDQSLQFVEIPEQALGIPPDEDTIEVRANREALDGGARLELLGAHISRKIPIPEQGLQAIVSKFSQQLFLGLVALFLTGLVIAAYIAHRVSDPLRRLQGAADRVGRGELGVQVDGQGVSEVNATVDAFNAMSRQLEQLEDTRQALRAQQHLSEIGEIGRGLAHSLRNPLNAIGLTVEELATRAGDQPDHRRMADDVRRQIQRIDRSIRAFLTLANAPDAAPQAIDVRDIVRDVALEVVQQVGRQVDVQVQLPDQPLVLQGLDTELRAMLQALIVNAAEASANGGHVSVELDRQSDGCRLTVKDQGPGLSQDIRERLFQPHATTKADGSGMGLYLTQRLASNRYAGRVELNEPSEGGLEARLWLKDREQEAL
jgi:nitrogen fixation/metabolism regulation signal transduction histidine kinase